MNFLKIDKTRVIGLDILRAIAILLVVYGHGSLFLSSPQLNFYYRLFLPAIDGVSIFFVLSGYLIGNILLKIIERSEFTIKDLYDFWIRRWFRTLPNYFFVLAILIILNILLHRSITGFNWQYLFFLQNFYLPHPSFFPEAWSLCVEEWFYLFFPILCYLFYKIYKNKKKAVLYSALFFLIAPFIARMIGYLLNYNFAGWDAVYRKVVIFRLDSLMYGVIAAYLFTFKKELWLRYKKIFLILGLVLVVLTTLHHKFWDSAAFLVVYRYNLDSIATFLMLPYFSEIKEIKFKKIASFFTFISIISYSMYLINLSLVLKILVPITASILKFNQIAGEFSFVLKYITFWTYTIFFSYLIYRFFEKPMTDLRDKIRK